MIGMAATKLSAVPQHTSVTFSEPHEPSIVFSSNFDSGNMSKVCRTSYSEYSIWTASDAEGSEQPGYPKSWFYFQVGGFGSRSVDFAIHRVHFLWALASRSQYYRPVYRIKYLPNEQQSQQKISEWNRLPHPVHSIALNSQEQLVLKFGFHFEANYQSVEFAFIYPYGHEQCHKDINQMAAQHQNDPEVFFKSYQLCRSYEGRTIDLVLLSSHEGKEGFENIKTDENFTLGDKKLQRFRNNKPVIFISARVHPIETPSSYTMTGILKFLTNKQDYRAHLLRKYFLFVLVPMLNPDGVSNGHCRMDVLNQNLNRYYKDPDPVKQPSCYSIVKLAEHYHSEKKLFMYLDLHAHPAFKGNFIFGNAIFDYIEQVESHLFPKVLSQNCISFEFEQCNFSRKHMKAKDRNEDMNKEGCGRVVFYKEFGLTHSYTLECGYHCNTYDNKLVEERDHHRVYIARHKTNQRGEHIYDNFEEAVEQASEQKIETVIKNLRNKKSQNGACNFRIFKNVADTLDQNNHEFYSKPIVFFEPQTFYNLGRNICISILDIWNKNPYTRLENINEQRVEIAVKQAKLDRFRKEQAGIRTKQKKVVELIEMKLYGEWHKRNVFQDRVASTVGFKKAVLRTSTNVKRNDKSLTFIDSAEQAEGSHGSAVKLPSSKHNVKNRQTAPKEEKKLGIVQPNIDSLKSILGSEPIRGPPPVRPLLESKTYFKPINIKIRNMHMLNK